MRDFSNDHSALARNTATLGHNLYGHGPGWPPERIIDAYGARELGGLVIGGARSGAVISRSASSVRTAGNKVVGLCRIRYGMTESHAV